MKIFDVRGEVIWEVIFKRGFVYIEELLGEVGEECRIFLCDCWKSCWYWFGYNEFCNGCYGRWIVYNNYKCWGLVDNFVGMYICCFLF